MKNLFLALVVTLCMAVCGSFAEAQIFRGQYRNNSRAEQTQRGERDRDRDNFRNPRIIIAPRVPYAPPYYYGRPYYNPYYNPYRSNRDGLYYFNGRYGFGIRF